MAAPALTTTNGAKPPYEWGNLPAAITQHSHFAFFWYVDVEGRDKPTKEPHQVRAPSRKASHSNPLTWAPFSAAMKGYERLAGTSKQPDGLLFALTTQCKLMGLDWDHCVDEHGTIDPEVQAVLDRLVGYKELSPSRRGVRCIVAGGSRTLDEKGRKVGNFELYNHSRFLSLTGWTLPGSTDPTVSMSDQVRGIIANLDAKQAAARAPASGQKAPTSIGPSPTLTDQEVIAKCRAAGNGSKFAALFDTDDLGLYDGDARDADMGLAGLLVFYTQDHTQIERLMRTSTLRREKWDRHKTYLRDTIAKVIDRFDSKPEMAIRRAAAAWDADLATVRRLVAGGNDAAEKTGMKVPAAGTVAIRRPRA
jgi:primase-polymerase (primpol)-like protein